LNSSRRTDRPAGRNEKDKIAGEAKIKEALDAARLELEQAQRAGDLAKMAELNYGTIPSLTKQLAEAAQATTGVAMLREEVTADDIAGVVSRWTGIPVDKMLEGEREKLLAMEEHPRQARDRPGGRR
jgi:ATP-dependent Clp protease ATP-binding subunit ClpB